MAKIENTTVYPLVTPNADDFIIGTDTSDGNRTVSFSIEGLTASGGLQGLQSVLGQGYEAASPMTLTGNLTVYGSIVPTTITAASSVGSSGQLLSSTGAGIQWVDTSVILSNTLQEVTSAGNTTTDGIVMDGGAISTTGSIIMSGGSQQLYLTNGTSLVLSVGSAITTLSEIILGGASSILNFGATATISDYANNTGAAGQVLTVNAAGTGVEWSTGIPVASMPTLQEVLTSGNTATGVGVSFSGAASTFSVSAPITSYAPNVWHGTNSFLGNGTAIDTAGIALSGSLWDGGNTGTSNQVLTSTVTGVRWQDVSAVGVSSVTTATPIDAASPQIPITIIPTSGAVVVRQNIYNGGSLIGCVPDGGTNTTFLRGDGSWVAPSSSPTAPEGYMSYLFNAVRQDFTATNYYTLTVIGQTAQRISFDTDLGASSPAAMSVAMTDIEHVTGCFLHAPTGVTCGSAYPNMKVCDMDFQFVGDAAVAGASWEIQLWKTSQCTSGTYTLAGTATFTSISADTLECRSMVWVSAALQTLNPGEAFFITAKADTAVSSGDFQLNTSMRWKGMA
tara:strand:+ start:1621 stop:3309 length:1689 start_codon:yes stop_codon:yes gene_type:complete